MVNAVKRLGKAVYVIFFYDSGLAPALRLASDESFRLDEFFKSSWQGQPSGGLTGAGPDGGQSDQVVSKQ